MAAGAFNPLETAHDLEAAGFDRRRQAEAIAKAIDHGDDRAAAKEDLNTVATALDARMTTIEARLTATLYRALWIQGGAIIAIIAALRFLPI